MNNLLNNSSISLLFIFALLLSIPSCTDPVPGCTDEQSENYDSEATEDNGSCTYARTKFLGDYIGPFTCTNPLLKGVLDSDSLEFVIKEAVADDRQLVVLGLLIEGIPVDLEGMINGNELIIRDTFTNFAIPDFPNPVDSTQTLTLIANVIGDGTATLSADETTITGVLNLDIQATDGSLNAQDMCDLIGTKKE